MLENRHKPRGLVSGAVRVLDVPLDFPHYGSGEDCGESIAMGIHVALTSAFVG